MLLSLLSCLVLLVEAAASKDKKDSVPTKFMIFREDCFDAFFTRYDFVSDPSCLKFTFSKLVGYLIIAGSTVFKLPQIINIVKAGSSKGISTQSYYFETLVFVNTLSYSRHLQLSFSVYGETIIIISQNVFIIGLIYNYDKTVSAVEKILFTLFLTCYGGVLLMDTIVPE